MTAYTQPSFLASLADKQCSKCKVTRPLSEFRRSRGFKDGVHPSCKVCDRAYREANRERIAAKDKAYNESHKEQKQQYRKDYWQRNKERLSARSADYHTSNRDRIAAQDKAYYGANREAISAKRRARYHANPDVYRAQCAARRATHREEAAQTAKSWREANRDRFMARIKQRKYRLRTATVADNPEETVAFVAMLRRDPCSYCGAPGGTIDHIVPLSKGGSHHSSNLAASCMTCNNKKKARSLLSFIHLTGLNGIAIERTGD